VLKKHYSHRASIFWAGFALIEDGHIQGVVVFGQPSPPIQLHAFKDRDFRIYELARLVVQTRTRNAASFLVGRSLQMLPSPCAVVSYADGAMGHVGYIYQATNWLYTGATLSKDVLYMVDGKPMHALSLTSTRGITAPRAWARENGIEIIKPHPKHRYFMVTGNRRQKADMLSRLKYPVLPYPKGDSNRYDAGADLVVPYLVR
jgi:hypothetical protein